MKNTLIYTLYYYTLIFSILSILLIFPIPFFHISEYFYGEDFYSTRTILVIPCILFWIYNLYLWSKFDKNVIRFFLLFFFNALYSLYYFKRAKKLKWI